MDRGESARGETAVDDRALCVGCGGCSCQGIGSAGGGRGIVRSAYDRDFFLGIRITGLFYRALLACESLRLASSDRLTLWEETLWNFVGRDFEALCGKRLWGTLGRDFVARAKQEITHITLHTYLQLNLTASLLAQRKMYTVK